MVYFMLLPEFFLFHFSELLSLFCFRGNSFDALSPDCRFFNQSHRPHLSQGLYLRKDLQTIWTSTTLLCWNPPCTPLPIKSLLSCCSLSSIHFLCVYMFPFIMNFPLFPISNVLLAPSPYSGTSPILHPCFWNYYRIYTHIWRFEASLKLRLSIIEEEWEGCESRRTRKLSLRMYLIIISEDTPIKSQW